MKAKDIIFLPLLVPLLILAGCGGGSGSDSGSSSAGSRGSTAELVSISVTPGNPNVPADVNGQLTAFGTYSDGTTSDITTQVTWRSSNTAVATVDSRGLGTAVAAGNAKITATSGSIAGTATFAVTAATFSRA